MKVNHKMISADLNRMYARALEEQRRGRDIEKAKRERIEAEVARLEAERIRVSEASTHRKHKRPGWVRQECPERRGTFKNVRARGRQLGEPRMPPIAFERKVNKFIELYRSIPADQRLHGSDGDPIFDFMLNKHTLADMYAAKTGKRLSRYSLKRVMEAACVKV